MPSLFVIRHTEPRQRNVKAQAYTQKLFKGTWCLSLHCCHFNKLNKVCVFVCKDARTGTQANSEADVPNEEHTAREGRIIRLVSGIVHVFQAYIIQGERESTTPSLYVNVHWQARVGCLITNTVLLSRLQNLCIFEIPQCTAPGQKLFARSPPAPCSSAAAGVFSVHGTAW